MKTETKKQEESMPQQSSATTDSQSSSKPAAKPAPAKREKSNLFNSFAKAKPKQKTSTAPESVSLDVVILVSTYLQY